jgi:ferric-dicitrate binding protein FerR (iron transport regulator)
MEKFFKSREDILTDESFLSWFYHPTPEKEQEWKNWLALHPDQKLLVDEALALLSGINIKEDHVPSSAVETAWQRLDASINDSNKEKTPVFQIKTSRRWWQIAAAAAIILFAGLSIWKFTGNKKTVLAANYGEITNHKLPDGSEVILNANSSVTLGKNWEDGSDREVWLKGEAFFHVTKTSQHNRFIVHANQIDIIVTGTQFNVVTRDDHSSVLLTEGSVVIRSKDGKETLMKPGDFVEINNNQFERKPANEEMILAWKENNLIFDNTPMPEAARIISEHYGIKVTLGDQQVKERPLTGFMQNNNLDVLIRSLQELDFKITKKDNEIIISSL